MPTYVLEVNTPARITAGPLRLDVHATGPAGQVTLGALAAGAPLPGTVSRPNMLVIPKLAALASVIVAPQAGGVFADGSVLDLTIGIEGPPTADPEQIVLKVDVSGLGEGELLTIEPRDGSIIAYRRGVVDPSGGALSGLAKIAQIATREVLGVESVGATSAINVVIAIDGSASMLAPTKDGRVGALVDVLAGVSAVVGPGRSVAAAIVGGSVAWVESGEVRTLSADVARAQQDAALSTGFRSSDPGLVGHRPDENTVTWVLTDALPSDLSGLRLADDIEGEARHLVLFADAQAMRLQGDPGITSTLVEPVDTEEGVPGRLEYDPVALRRLIKSLLVGCFVPGTDFAKRVSS